MKLQEQFNQVSAQYDSERYKLIPCLSDFYQTAVENLKFETETPRILDLGAGTGLLSQKILEHFPKAKITLIDLSDKMLDVARQRFQGLSQIDIILKDYTEYQAQHPFDAIVSSLSIHHLPNDEKIKLYKNCYAWLNAGGTFINADQALAPNPYLEKLYSKQWRQKVESTDLKPEAIAAAYERVNLDIRTPLHLQLEWLSEAGFNNVDCLYKSYDFVVMYGEKANR